jgi:hypothetical protein
VVAVAGEIPAVGSLYRPLGEAYIRRKDEAGKVDIRLDRGASRPDGFLLSERRRQINGHKGKQMVLDAWAVTP